MQCEWEEDERTLEDLFLTVLNPHLSTNSLVLYGSWLDIRMNKYYWEPLEENM